MGGRDTESQVERRLRPLRGRQRHRESGEKTIKGREWHNSEKTISAPSSNIRNYHA